MVTFNCMLLWAFFPDGAAWLLVILEGSVLCSHLASSAPETYLTLSDVPRMEKQPQPATPTPWSSTPILSSGGILGLSRQVSPCRVLGMGWALLDTAHEGQREPVSLCSHKAGVRWMYCPVCVSLSPGLAERDEEVKVKKDL